MYTVSLSNSICSRFYFYINYIELQDCRDSWFFLQSLLFRKNTYKERIEGSNDRTGGRPRRMSPRRLASQRVGIRILVVVMLLFKEIWETLEKPSPLINYCITIDDTRIIKNTRPSFPIVS